MDFEVEEVDPRKICGEQIPPNLDCIAKLKLPPILDFNSIVFLSCSIFIILINAILVIYVLSKTPKRRNYKKRTHNTSSKKAIFKIQADSTVKSKYA